MIRLFSILTLIAVGNLSFAQQFVAKTSNSSVPMGKRFKIVYSTSQPGNGFTGPDLSNFQVIMGPSFSQNVRISGNQMVGSFSYSYVLTPKKEGTHTISGASINVSGKKLTSNSLTIKVTKGAPGSGSAKANANNGGGSTDISKYLFLRGYSSKNTVYLGEQLTATYKLYNSVRFVDSGIEKMPSLNGFWSQDVISPFDHVTWKSEVRNGRQFEVADLKKTVLFPQRTGKLQIDPLEMVFEVQQVSRNFFDNFFGRARSKKFKVASPVNTITVLPLPSKGKPENFTGGVGDFKIMASIDQAEVAANDAINLKIKIEGAGNLQLLEPLQLNLPGDFEVYDPKINDDISVLASGVRGIREFEYLLIPRHAGNFEIEAVSFSYFDPKKKRYYTKSTDAIPIRVTKGTSEDAGMISSRGISKEEVQLLNEDIRHIQSNGYTEVAENQGFFGSKGYWLLTGLPFLLLIGAFAYRRKYEERKHDVAGKRERHANRLAGRYLKQARAALNSGDHGAVYEHVALAMNGFLSDKLRIDTSQFTRERIEEILESKGVENDTIQALHNLMQDCDMARYSAANVAGSENALSGAERLIQTINKRV